MRTCPTSTPPTHPRSRSPWARSSACWWRSRRPRNPVGWLILFIAAASALQGVDDQYTRFALLTHPGLPGAVWSEWLGSFVAVPIFPAGAVAWLLVLLPDGHLPSPRWRLVLVAGAVDTAVLMIVTAFAPGPLNVSTNGANYPDLNNPLGLGALQAFSANGSQVLGGVIWFLGLAILLIAGVAPLLRLRRASGDERQQLKWIAYAVLVTVATVVVFVFLAGSILPSWTFDIPIVLGLRAGLPGEHRDGDLQVPAVRHRRGHQPHAGVRLAGGCSSPLSTSASPSGWARSWAVGASPTWHCRSSPPRSSRWGSNRCASACSASPTGSCTASGPRRTRCSRSSPSASPSRTPLTT